MDGNVAFRAARADDAQFLSRLLGELGYPTPAAEVPDRLVQLAAFPKTLVLVAEIDGEVGGLITMIIYPSIHAKQPVAFITSLVVAPEYRGKGIGSDLVGRGERWAVDNGAIRVSVGSGLHRKDAHQFYENLFYELSGMRFTRWLNKDSGTR